MNSFDIAFLGSSGRRSMAQNETGSKGKAKDLMPFRKFGHQFALHSADICSNEQQIFGLIKRTTGILTVDKAKPVKGRSQGGTTMKNQDKIWIGKPPRSTWIVCKV